MIAVAVLFGAPAAIEGNNSVFIWIDVGFCLTLAVLLFVIGLRGCRSHPGRRAPAVQWGRTPDKIIVLAAVVAIFAPAVKGLVELGQPGHSSFVIVPGECKPEIDGPRS